MEIITNEISLSNEIINFLPINSLFFDIETTGLSPKYHEIYLIGCMHIKNNKGAITLIFANHPGEEDIIIREFLNLASRFDTLLTFNGDRFDIPFVISRAERYGIYNIFNDFNTTDIYKSLRPFKRILGIKKLSQKSLEEFMGLYRKDSYNGGELIDVYKRFLKTKDSNLRKLLIQHNYDDICGMGTIILLLSLKMLHTKEFEITNIVQESDEIIFRCQLPGKLAKPVRILGENYHIKAKDNSIVGTLSVEHKELKLFMPNTKDYIYLPIEDMIIPKSMATTIPKERILRATKENCYVKISSTFFKLPTDKKFKSFFNLSSNMVYKENYSDKTGYVKITKNNKDSSGVELSLLINSLLTYCFT